MARGRQLVRELVLQLLETTRNGRTIEDLAEETGVTTRTIRRDLAALEEAGIPLARRWRALNWRKEAA